MRSVTGALNLNVETTALVRRKDDLTCRQWNFLISKKRDRHRCTAAKKEDAPFSLL